MALRNSLSYDPLRLRFDDSWIFEINWSAQTPRFYTKISPVTLLELKLSKWSILAINVKQIVMLTVVPLPLKRLFSIGRYT